MSLAAAGRRAVLSLLEDVYGDWRADPAAWQPRPLPLGEAGDFRLLEGGPRPGQALGDQGYARRAGLPGNMG